MGSIKNPGSRSVLEALEDICNVDVDAIDPAVATAMPFKPHNQTSNQVIGYNTMVQPEFRDLFVSKVKEYGSQGWEEVFIRVMVHFCANNIKNITGRVLVQVAPRHVYNKDAVLKYCYAYDKAFQDAGISREKYAIKMAVTGPAMAAAAMLNKEGIRTLGTSVFGLPQAIAASQAGCLFISPYFNEVGADADESTIHRGTDPALTHPMSPRVIHILETYTKLYKDTGKDQPLIVMASNANIKEIIGNAELGCQHITILAHHMKELQETPLDDTALSRFPIFANSPPKKKAPYYANLVTSPRFAAHSTSDPLAGPDWNGKLARTDIDYVADNGKNLDKANAQDPIVALNLKKILAIFHEFDEKAREAIETEYNKA